MNYLGVVSSARALGRWRNRPFVLRVTTDGCSGHSPKAQLTRLKEACHAREGGGKTRGERGHKTPGAGASEDRRHEGPSEGPSEGHVEIGPKGWTLGGAVPNRDCPGAVGKGPA